MKAFKIFWIVSFLVFMAVLVYTNAFLPPIASLTQPVMGHATYTLDKEVLFYGLLILCVSFNALIMALGYLSYRAALVFPSPFFLIPKRAFWLSSLSMRRKMGRALRDWLKGAGLLLNLGMSSFLFYVYSLNVEEFNPGAPVMLPIVWILLFVFWMVYIFYYFVSESSNPEAYTA